MASEYLRKKIQEYESYIDKYGINDKIIDAYLSATYVAIKEERDISFGLEKTKKLKSYIDEFVQNKTEKTIWQLEKYAVQTKTEYSIISKYYEILKSEAPYKFESYLLYLEKNREISERFYSPKMKQLNKHGLIQAMQDLEDDKLDILSISMPPGTQKCQPLYSKVLTPNGFIQMGEVDVGTRVVSGTGNIATVLSVSKVQKKKIYEITLENGYKCRCSADHLWHVRYNYFANKFKEKDVELNEILLCPYKYLIPVTTERLNNAFYLRVGVIECIGEEECKCIYIDDPSHLYITDNYIITHNTTLEKFFCSWIIGRHPKDYSLFFSHSDDITRMFYDGVLDITTNYEEYTWNEIFPNVKLHSTDAKRQRINFDKQKAYSNIQCTSVGSKNAGKVRCNRYLYCDDLIGGIEEALNKRTLDKIWRIYGTDARQRKLNGKVKEIHIATRWSVHDVIGRLKQIYAGNDRVRFIAIPDIDPLTGESNFDYEYNGMSVEFFRDQELGMDDISYRCLYKNEPIEREGLLYREDDIRRFMSMPMREPDAILGICDVKNKGTDFMFLPCMYQYDNDFYLLDCICDDNTDYGVQYERLSNIIVEHNMQQCEFESNSGGDRVSYEVNKRVEEKGGRCNITDKPTETNKETRIIVNADWVKKHVLFKDRENYNPKDDYGVMMTWLLTYSVVGKNEHDDVPDGLANFALFITQPTIRKPTVIMSSPI